MEGVSSIGSAAVSSATPSSSPVDVQALVLLKANRTVQNAVLDLLRQGLSSSSGGGGGATGQSVNALA